MTSDESSTSAAAFQTEKMATLGVLAAGVAHEINNPISYVGANLETLEKYAEALQHIFARCDSLVRLVLEGDAQETRRAALDLREQLEEADVDYVIRDLTQLTRESAAGIARVREIVKNLRLFIRPDEEKPVAADLNECIECAVKILACELKHGTQLVKKLAPLPRTSCYPGQLGQVFMNLILNAVQAITKERGTVEIETFSGGGNIWVKVADDGPGIPSENLEKLFTPFFTTKPAGKGTGLGLSVCDSIIRRHGGRIEVTSEVGRGTVFTVVIPIRDGE